MCNIFCWNVKLGSKVVVLLISSVITFNLICGESLKHKILNSIVFNTTYDNRIPPGLDFGELEDELPTNVTVNIIITQISDVNVDEMDFSVTLFLTQKWLDHRLTFNSTANILQLSENSMERIWTPDTYFVTSKSGFTHGVTKPNNLMHIWSNGTVVYRTRLSVKVACQMDFQWYPLDTQRCVIRLESSGFTADELMYTWNEDKPVVILSENLPLYNIQGKPSAKVDLCSHGDEYKTGFSCLKTTIEIQRSIGYYLTEMFIPDILIVVLSWVSFWLHPLAVPGRVSLGAVTVLTISSQGSASKRYSPKVSYVKAVDVWTLFQILFVFSAMVEFSIVNVMARIKDRNTEDSHENNNETIKRPFLRKAIRIDYLSRFLFPAAYSIFNTMFWIAVTYVNRN